jgi:hypothetical protein
MRDVHEDEMFFCKYNENCARFFKTKEEKDEHIKKVHESSTKFARCFYCKKMISKSYLSKHLRLFHKSVAIKCEYMQKCPTYFHSEDERKKHYIEVHEKDTEKNMWCKLCGKMINSNGCIFDHMRVVHKIEISSSKRAQEGIQSIDKKCIYCNEIVKEISFRRHISLKHKAAIRCNFKCWEYFLSDEERQKHVLQVHSKAANEQMKKCVYCNEMVKVCRIWFHIRDYHSKVAIRCKSRFCVTYFKTKEEQEIHYNEKHLFSDEFKQKICTKCSYKCLSADTLRDHMLSKHSNENLKCEICKKPFKSAFSLKYHVKKSHTKTRQCKICKVFVRNLKEHALSNNCRLN